MADAFFKKKEYALRATPANIADALSGKEPDRFLVATLGDSAKIVGVGSGVSWRDLSRRGLASPCPASSRILWCLPSFRPCLLVLSVLLSSPHLLSSCCLPFLFPFPSSSPPLPLPLPSPCPPLALPLPSPSPPLPLPLPSPPPPLALPFPPPTSPHRQRQAVRLGWDAATAVGTFGTVSAIVERKGVGSACVVAAEAMLREQQCKRIEMHVIDCREDVSRAKGGGLMHTCSRSRGALTRACCHRRSSGRGTRRRASSEPTMPSLLSCPRSST